MGILYFINPNGDAGQLLEEVFAASEMQHRTLWTHDLLFLQSAGTVEIFLHDEQLQFSSDDFVYIKSSEVDRGGACLFAHVLNQKGVRFSDPANLSGDVVTDKAFQSIVFPLRKVAFPKTLVARKETLVAHEKLIRELFSDTFVLKTSGRKGEGVTRCDLSSGESLSDQIEAVLTDENRDKLITIQEMIEKRCDFRVLVVNGSVVGRLKKCSDSLRTHFSHGGTSEAFEESDDIAALDALAIAATEAAGYTVSGVDIVKNGDTLQVFEVNKNPGMHGLEEEVRRHFVSSLWD